MPHVVIEGPSSVETFYQEFEPINIREYETIMKVKDVLLNTNKMKVLLECVVVEDRISHMFYTVVSQKDGKVTVRLDPLTDPEKNYGVKRLLAIVAYKLKSQDSMCRYGKHNLAGYLIE